MSAKIAIIGGTGLEDPSFLSDRHDLEPVETPYGRTTDVIVAGKLNGVDVIMMARHGKGHGTPPSSVPYRANIYALAEHFKVDAILTGHAVGSLRGDLHKVGDICAFDQFLDFTARGGGLRGPQTFYDAQPGHLKGVCHIPMVEPFSAPIRQILINSAKTQDIAIHETGTCVVCEGPRFSSKAESHAFRMMGAHCIGMTLVPEVVLANELGVPFASLGIITDLDSEDMVHNGDQHASSPAPPLHKVHSVSHDIVLENMKRFGTRAANIFSKAMPEIASAVQGGRMRNPPSVH